MRESPDRLSFPIRRVEKPWGHERIFAAGDRYVGKIIFIRAGCRLSLQYHRLKDETMTLLSGSAEVHVGSSADDLKTMALTVDEALHLPPGAWHRLAAIEDSEVLEVSTPELDDVVRIEDDYGREGTNSA